MGVLESADNATEKARIIARNHFSVPDVVGCGAASVAPLAPPLLSTFRQDSPASTRFSNSILVLVWSSSIFTLRHPTTICFASSSSCNCCFSSDTRDEQQLLIIARPNTETAPCSEGAQIESRIRTMPSWPHPSSQRLLRKFPR